jgi:hypothetical protein
MKQNHFSPSALKCCAWGIVGHFSFLVQVFAGGMVNVCDEGNLRAALAGGGTVTFDCDGTIFLANTLKITNATTIDASGHSITLSGSNAVRIFYINPGVTAWLINLRLANGYFAGSNGVAGSPPTPGQPGAGAAVFNEGGTVVLTGCMLVSNTVVGGVGYSGPSSSAGGAGEGAAIWNLGGNVSVTNCYFTVNQAMGGAGGLGGLQGAPGGNGTGGAIGNLGGSLIIESSLLISNTAAGGLPGNPTASAGQAGGGFGGGIWGSNTAAIYSASIFAGNEARGADVPATAASTSSSATGSAMGGALFSTNGTVICAYCTFSTNRVRAGHRNVNGGSLGLARGGGISSHATSTFSQCAFVGNQALGNGIGNIFSPGGGEGGGGAVFNDSTLAASECLFSGNAALGAKGGDSGLHAGSGGDGLGGAVWNVGTLNVTNCTLTGNSAIGGDAGTRGGPADGGSGKGGGLNNSGGTANLVNVTISSNRVASGRGQQSSPGLSLGGGIYNMSGIVSLLNTIIARSLAGSNAVGTLTDMGYNLSSDASCGFAGPGSLNSTDPLLGPLDDYGGPTLTMPLLAGSPALDGGSSALAPLNDQRGRSRPYGVAADIGAFESSPPYVVKGRVTGYLLDREVAVDTGGTGVTTSNGFYRITGLAPGPYLVAPSNTSFVFGPNDQLLTVGPDRLNIDFRAYRWNSLSIEGITNGSFHLVFAGTNGATRRVLISSNLTDWSASATNVIGPSNYFHIFDPVIAGRASRFYRTDGN